MLTQICVFLQGVHDGVGDILKSWIHVSSIIYTGKICNSEFDIWNLKKIKMILIHIAHSVVTTLPTYTRGVVEDFQCSFLMVSKMALRNMSRTRTRNFVLFFPAIRAIFLTTALLVKKKYRAYVVIQYYGTDGECWRCNWVSRSR